MKNTGSEVMSEIVGPAGLTSEGVCSVRYWGDEDDEEDDELWPPSGDCARAIAIPIPAQRKNARAVDTAAGRFVHSFIEEPCLQVYFGAGARSNGRAGQAFQTSGVEDTATEVGVTWGFVLILLLRFPKTTAPPTRAPAGRSTAPAGNGSAAGDSLLRPASPRPMGRKRCGSRKLALRW